MTSQIQRLGRITKKQSATTVLCFLFMQLIEQNKSM